MAVSIGTTAFNENRVDAKDDFLLPVVTAAAAAAALLPLPLSTTVVAVKPHANAPDEVRHEAAGPQVFAALLQ